MKHNKLSDEQLARELVQMRDEQISSVAESRDESVKLSIQLDSAKRVMALLAKARPSLGGRSNFSPKENSLIETVAGHDTKPDAGDDGRVSSEQIPSTIARFEIESLLGQGGFGLVFLARDPELDRKVAIKVPTFCSLINEDAQVRFKRESRVVASLSHPNIVPVYEVGNDGPISFIASKFIEGTDLAKWVNEHGALGPRDAAQAVSVIAEAIQHAHNRGVVHRDLKPANILLPLSESDSKFDPTSVCVVDFGLAKFLAESDEGQTRAGSIIGTPAFSAPEQLQSTDASVMPERSDVYSLGAVLYFLITGNAPFLADSLSEMVSKVRNESPLAPWKRNPLVSGDLSAICMKCLEKSPEDRYPSAHELTKDLTRFLGGETVLARPLPIHQRAWKWCCRNPTVAGLSFIATTAVVGGLVASLWSASNARASADESRRQYLESKKVIDDYFVKVSERPLFASTAFRSVKRELLESALGYYRNFADENPDDISLRLELAGIHHRLGDSFLDVSELKEAEKEYQASLELIDRSVAGVENDDQRSAHQLLRAMNQVNLGLIDVKARENDSAVVHLDSAIKILEGLQQKQSDNEEVLNELVQAYTVSGNLNFKRGGLEEYKNFAIQTQLVIEEFAVRNTLSPLLENQLAISLGNQAIYCLRTNKLGESAELLDKAIRISGALVESQSIPVLFSETLANHLAHRGMVDLNRGKANDSAKFLRRANDLLNSLSMLNTTAEFISNHQQVSLRLGYVLGMIGQKKEAMEANEFAVESARRLVQNYPDVVGYKTSLASVCFTICGIKTHSLELGEAEELLDEGRGILTALQKSGVKDASLARMADGIASSEARLFLYQGRYDEALEACVENLTALQNKLKESSDPRSKFNLSVAYENRAFVLIQMGEYARAAEDRANVLELVTGSDRPMYLLFHAETLGLSGKVVEAMKRIAEYNELVTDSTPNPRGRAMQLAFAQTAIAIAIEKEDQDDAGEKELAEEHLELAEEAFLKSVDLGYFVDRPYQIELIDMRADLSVLMTREAVKPIVEEQRRIWKNTKE